MANKQIAAAFARLADETGWTTRELARQVNCAQQTVSNWRGAVRAIPPEIYAWVEAVAKFKRANPPPDYQQLRDPAAGGRPMTGEID